MGAEPDRAASADVADAERWIVIGGRRWRASDPALAEPFRQALVDQLMAGRRGVAAAHRAQDPAAEASARRTVHAAKVALGERGEPWWEASPEGIRLRLAAIVTTLADHRGGDKTICPSDAARTLGGEHWHDHMDDVRDVVRELARSGRVELSQRGRVLDPDEPWKGPIRIRTIEA